jgi:hypothetical protein
MYAGLVIPIRLAIVGDTQRVLPIERLAFGRETNDAGRRRIAQAILAEQLDGIVHLGDLIGSASGWRRFDQDYPSGELASKHIHVCRGNHDCGGLWFGSSKEFNRRFPTAVAGLQTVELGFLRLLLLDTNQGSMSKEQWLTQLNEFCRSLTDANSEERVKHVLVAGHHPPFTNARWHSPSPAVLDGFIKPLLDCPKARTFFAGHVHGYERFEVDGRCFVVTGGGGGARFAHRHSEKRRRPAMVDISDPHPLHFVSVEASPDVISYSVRAIDECSGGWVELDRWAT